MDTRTKVRIHERFWFRRGAIKPAVTHVSVRGLVAEASSIKRTAVTILKRQ